MELDHFRSAQVRMRRQNELESTRKLISQGVIYSGQPISEYLALTDPCERDQYGRYQEFQHGFPNGLGHGITVIAKDGCLIKAYSWSCLGGEEFFNSMTDFDVDEFSTQSSWARLSPY